MGVVRPLEVPSACSERTCPCLSRRNRRSLCRPAWIRQHHGQGGGFAIAHSPPAWTCRPLVLPPLVRSWRTAPMCSVASLRSVPRLEHKLDAFADHVDESFRASAQAGKFRNVVGRTAPSRRRAPDASRTGSRCAVECDEISLRRYWSSQQHSPLQGHHDVVVALEGRPA